MTGNTSSFIRLPLFSTRGRTLRLGHGCSYFKLMENLLKLVKTTELDWFLISFSILWIWPLRFILRENTLNFRKNKDKHGRLATLRWGSSFCKVCVELAGVWMANINEENQLKRENHSWQSHQSISYLSSCCMVDLQVCNDLSHGLQLGPLVLLVNDCGKLIGEQCLPVRRRRWSVTVWHTAEVWILITLMMMASDLSALFFLFSCCGRPLFIITPPLSGMPATLSAYF